MCRDWRSFGKDELALQLQASGCLSYAVRMWKPLFWVLLYSGIGHMSPALQVILGSQDSVVLLLPSSPICNSLSSPCPALYPLHKAQISSVYSDFRWREKYTISSSHINFFYTLLIWSLHVKGDNMPKFLRIYHFLGFFGFFSFLCYAILKKFTELFCEFFIKSFIEVFLWSFEDWQI